MSRCWPEGHDPHVCSREEHERDCERDATHWSYGSGMSGCLYDSSGVAETLDAAIDAALFIFADDLSDGELELARKALAFEGIWYFEAPETTGADYVEVCEQDGPMPEDCE